MLTLYLNNTIYSCKYFGGIMNILQVIASGGLGGREMQPVRLAERMRDKGHKTFLLVINKSLSIPIIKDAKLPYFELRMNGYLNLFSILPLAKILKENCIDVIHTHYSKSLFFIIIAKSLSRRKIKLVFTQRMGVNVSKNDIFHRFVYSKTYKIAAISKYVKGRLLRAAPFLKGKINIVHNGCMIKDKQLGINDSKKFNKEFKVKKGDVLLTLVAQVNHGKGHFWVLDSIKELKNKHKIKNIKVFFVGEGGLKDELVKYAKKTGVYNNVVFTGFRWDVDYFYRNVDIVLVASKAEAGGNVIFEGMIFSKPVICSDTGYFPEVIKNEEHGLVVKYNNIEALNSAIIRLIKSKGLRSKLGKKGRKRVVENFSYNNTIKNYLELYQ